jgi:hypothetical protein
VCAAAARVRGAGPGAETAARYLAGAGLARITVESAALAEELRGLRPDLRVELAPPDERPDPGDSGEHKADGGGLAVELGELRLVAARGGIADGAALALEALKALLGLPHRTAIDVVRLHQDPGAAAP